MRNVVTDNAENSAKADLPIGAISPIRYCGKGEQMPLNVLVHTLLFFAGVKEQLFSEKRKSFII